MSNYVWCLAFYFSCIRMTFSDIQRGNDCRRSNHGTDYFGHIHTTASGRICQRWDAQHPHPHNYTHDWYFPERSVSKAHNYCRNPETSGKLRLWCFTSDHEVPWEYCDVPKCASFPECKQTTTGVEYKGHLNMAKSGRNCTFWGPTYPDISHNFCRNPDSKSDGPWCFTNPKHTEWEYCDISFCKPSASCLSEPSGRRYVGTTSMTRRSVPCQRWAADVPHTPRYSDPEDFPDASPDDAADYCRNPASSKDSPWCYTLDPDVEWDYCDIPVCTDCKVSDIGQEYAGRIASSVSGSTCQRWDSQTPHSHEFTDPDRFPDATVHDAGNFCRNPDKNPSGPWCFTNEHDVVRETCDITLCQDDPEQPIREVKHVLHIGIDGLHPCFAKANVSNIMGRLARQGSYTLTKGRGILPSVSLPSWTATHCSSPVHESGVNSNSWRPLWLGNDWDITPVTGGNVPIPCLMDILQRTDANVHTAMFYNFDVLFYLASSGAPGRLDKDEYCDGPSTEGSYYQCDLYAATNASEYIKGLATAVESSYTFVYFVNVDEMGHVHGWCSNEYLQAASAADDMVGMLLDAVDSTGLMDEVLVLLTVDHGGRDSGHGANGDEDLQTPVFIRGPGIKRNYQIQYGVQLVDFAPTIAHLMGYKPSPWWNGHVLTEVLQSPLKYAENGSKPIFRSVLSMQVLIVIFVGCISY